MEAERGDKVLHGNGCVRGHRQHRRLRKSSGLLADREADVAALNLSVQDLVVEASAAWGSRKT